MVGATGTWGNCGTCRYMRFDDEYPMEGAWFCGNRSCDYYEDYVEWDDGCYEWEDAWEGVGMSDEVR